jgi:hypothetical protein
MRTRIFLAVFAALLVVPAAAFASLAGEQRQGAQLLGQLRSGAKACSDLSSEDFDHIGEYAMGRALGSVSAHQAMSDRMSLMLGDKGEQRMHELMGQRYAGCGGAAAGTMMGGGMMGGSYGSGNFDQMMGSRDWSWMMGGNWRHMSRSDWQNVQQQWMGGGMMGHHGWSAWAVVAVTLGAILLIALLVVALVRRPFRSPPAPAS